VNVGYGRDEIAQAMADQARRMVTTSARSKCAVNTAYSLSPTRW
jgi:adenosylmethionine-8-amino-7-oxononanoate aminotransferase